MLLQFSPDMEVVRLWQMRIAWGFVIFFTLALVVGLLLIKHRMRTSEEKRQLQSIKPQLLRATPAQGHLRHSKGGGQRREMVSQILDQDPPDEESARRVLQEAYDDFVYQSSPLPPALMRGLAEAIALVVMAAVLTVAIISVDGWLLPESGGVGYAAEYLLLLGILLWMAISGLFGFVLGLPVLSSLRDPATGATVAVVLAVLLVGLTLLFHRVDDRRRERQWIFVDRPILIARLVWWLTVRVAVVVLAVIGMSLLVDGHLVSAVATLIGIGPVGWGILLGAPILFMMGLGALNPERARELQLAIGRSIHRTTTSASWLLFGAPILVVVVTILFVASMTASWLYTIAAAAAAGIGSRLLLWAYGQIRYRFEPPTTTIDRVDEVEVSAFEIEDADGEVIYIVAIDDHYLAHRDKDELADTAIAAASWRLDGPRTERDDRRVKLPLILDRDVPKHMPAVEHYYYEQLSENGRVDFDDVRQSVRGDVETRIKATIRENGGQADREQVLTELRREYPAGIVREAVNWLRYETGQVYESNGNFELR